MKFVVSQFEPFDYIEILLISLTKGISSLIIDVDKRLIGRNGMFVSLLLFDSKAFHSFSFFDIRLMLFIPRKTQKQNEIKTSLNTRNIVNEILYEISSINLEF